MNPKTVLAFLRDPAVPKWRKGAGLFALAYFLMPLDLVPDVIPLVGWLDDVGVLALTAGWFWKQVSAHAARQLPAAGKAGPVDGR